jgi:hypothetical protein
MNIRRATLSLIKGKKSSPYCRRGRPWTKGFIATFDNRRAHHRGLPAAPRRTPSRASGGRHPPPHLDIIKKIRKERFYPLIPPLFRPSLEVPLMRDFPYYSARRYKMASRFFSIFLHHFPPNFPFTTLFTESSPRRSSTSCHRAS